MAGPIIRFEANRRGRDFVVGDLHGHYDLLMQALTDVSFDSEIDRLFSVGDLVDRGPDSARCLALTLEPWFHAVRGNHEIMMSDALLNNRGPGPWLANGGEWILGEDRKRIEHLAREALARMPYVIELTTAKRRIGIVHAEPPGDWNQLSSEIDEATLLWARRRIAKEDQTLVSNIDCVYVGHTPVKSPLTLGNVRYIDTGAFNTGKLTLEEITE